MEASEIIPALWPAPNPLDSSECRTPIPASEVSHEDHSNYYNAKLQLSVLEQDKTACLQTLRAMFSAMEETWKPQTSPLYRHLEGGETNIFSEWVSSSIREDLEKGEEFSFLRDCPEYQELLRELQGDRKQKA